MLPLVSRAPIRHATRHGQINNVPTELLTCKEVSIIQGSLNHAGVVIENILKMRENMIVR